MGRRASFGTRVGCNFWCAALRMPRSSRTVPAEIVKEAKLISALPTRFRPRTSDRWFVIIPASSRIPDRPPLLGFLGPAFDLAIGVPRVELSWPTATASPSSPAALGPKACMLLGEFGLGHGKIFWSEVAVAGAAPAAVPVAASDGDRGRNL